MLYHCYAHSKVLLLFVFKNFNKFVKVLDEKAGDATIKYLQGLWYDKGTIGCFWNIG